MVTVFGPTWGRKSRRGWRQGSRGWGEQGFEEELTKEGRGWPREEEEEVEEKGIQRWLSSGELLGGGQVSVPEISMLKITIQVLLLCGSKFDDRGITANLSEP